MRANRDTAARLARAITRTLTWMHTHTPQEIAAKTPKAFRGEDDGAVCRGAEGLDADVLTGRRDGAGRRRGRADAARRLDREGAQPPPSTCRKPTPMNSFMDAKTLLFVGLAVMLVIYAVTCVSRRLRDADARCSSSIGFVTSFFDTLGIGSFATTTAVYKLRRHGAGEADSRHAQRRPHAADHCAGVHLHPAGAGRVDDAGADDRRRRWPARGSAPVLSSTGRDARSRSAWGSRCSAPRC